MTKQGMFPLAAVIFDMDGVLVDTERQYIEEERAFGAEVLGLALSDEELFGMVGGSHQDFRSSMVSWFARAGIVIDADEACERFGAWESCRPRDYRALLNPGVASTIAELRSRGVRTALASSSPMKNIRTVLAACGLDDLFEVVVSGEQFKQSKPNPEIYLHTLELLGLSAEACCCVEDSVPGITAGKAAGLTVIAKREDRFGFSQADADYVIDAIPDLLSFTVCRPA